MDGKPVWPEYRDVIHCPPKDRGGEPEPVMGQPIVRSWDFGLTPCCIFSQITPRGQWIVFDEMIARDMGADQLSDEVREHSSRYYRSFRVLGHRRPGWRAAVAERHENVLPDNP